MQPKLFVGRSLSRLYADRTSRGHWIKAFSAFVAALLVLAALQPPAVLAAGSGTLKPGMSGTAVKTLQESLVKRGYLKTSADGKYGAMTATAVKLFQKHAGLKQDGVAGQDTQDRLYALTGSGKTNVTLKSGVKNSQVTVLQSRLMYLGYLSASSATNYFGATTKAAVKKFQAAYGLSADGVAGPKTLIKLYSPNKGERVVIDAKRYLGCPYVYGAEGPDKFDCSGLVYYVYKTYFGVTLPRSAQDMANHAGTAVESDGKATKARPGDILCFGSSVNSVGHVGIYIGNNQYIEAPQTGENVKITDLKRSVAVVKRVFTWN